MGQFQPEFGGPSRREEEENAQRSEQHPERGRRVSSGEEYPEQPLESGHGSNPPAELRLAAVSERESFGDGDEAVGEQRLEQSDECEESGCHRLCWCSTVDTEWRPTVGLVTGGIH